MTQWLKKSPTTSETSTNHQFYHLLTTISTSNSPIYDAVIKNKNLQHPKPLLTTNSKGTVE